MHETQEPENVRFFYRTGPGQIDLIVGCCVVFFNIFWERRQVSFHVLRKEQYDLLGLHGHGIILTPTNLDLVKRSRRLSVAVINK